MKIYTFPTEQDYIFSKLNNTYKSNIYRLFDAYYYNNDIFKIKIFDEDKAIIDAIIDGQEIEKYSSKWYFFKNTENTTKYKYISFEDKLKSYQFEYNFDEFIQKIQNNEKKLILDDVSILLNTLPIYILNIIKLVNEQYEKSKSILQYMNELINKNL